MKGYIGVYVVKAITERLGEFDSKKLAEALHCSTITTEDEPGVLLDIVYDENGPGRMVCFIGHGSFLQPHRAYHLH